MSAKQSNFDPQEVSKFDALATRWWDPAGEFRPLHELNPLRLSFIQSCTEIGEKAVIDVGCGGGILSESMARAGADVTGIDMASDALRVAAAHSSDAGLTVRYHQSLAEDWAGEHPSSYDVVTCMELLEHVPEPQSLVQACADMVRPGGSVFFSTVNRNAKAYALAVVAAEYILRLLPRGTHDYQRFIRPSELARDCRAAGLQVGRLSGLHYDPLTGGHALSENTDVNYILWARRPRNEG